MPAAFKSALLLVIAMTVLPAAGFTDSLRIYAAGSLTAAFHDLVKAFPAPPDAVAAPVFGPSGLLREKIEAGDRVDILASADMTQPRRLALAGQPVIMFTRNRLCALGRQGLGLTEDTLLARMLDPEVRLARSTPGADPGGDYAWAMFARADAVVPGAQAVRRAKALKLVGGPDTPPLVAGHGAIQGVFLADRADIMLGYCSSSGAVMNEVGGLVSVIVTPALSVAPSYGMIDLSDQPLAARFAFFVMSERGQAILQRHGFDPVGIAAP